LGDSLPLFVAVHKWKPEDDIVIMKELLAGFTAMLGGKLPEGIELCSTYMRSDHGAFCVWSSPGKKELEEQFRKYLPTMLKGTEFVPVIQSHPPTVEYGLELMKMIVGMASK
jgi:hypothetical protein